MTYGKVAEKHGLSGTQEFKIWAGLFQRCYNEKNSLYRYYGAKGIAVCDRWKRFLHFWADMGLRPSKKHSIDRMNGKLGYSPENCRWATAHQQAANISTNVLITHQGKTLCASEWARATGLSLATILSRYHEGMPAEQILASARQWKMLTYNGETMPYRTWARRLGIPETTFVRRITRGWPLEMVMADPIRAAHYSAERFYASKIRQAEQSAARATEKADPSVKVSANAPYQRQIGG